VLLVCHDSPRWPTSRTHCSSAVIIFAGLHFVRVPHLPSFSSPDNISYALPIWPHSPCRALLLHVARLTSLPQTYVWTCARNAVLGITGLLLIRVAHLQSFSSLAYISFALLVCRHSSHWPTSCSRCSSAVILLAGQHLVRVARLASFSSLAYLWYALLICCHSPSWPTSRSRCSSAVILLAGQHLVRITGLASFSSPAYLSYALLVLPHSSH